ICLITAWNRKLGPRVNVPVPTLIRRIVHSPAWAGFSPYYIIGTSFLFNLLLALVVLIFASVLIFVLRLQVRPYLDGSEDDWGFGQIMPNLLLLISLFAALEAACEEAEIGERWYSWLLRLPPQPAQVEQGNDDAGELPLR